MRLEQIRIIRSFSGVVTSLIAVACLVATFGLATAAVQGGALSSVLITNARVFDDINEELVVWHQQGLPHHAPIESQLCVVENSITQVAPCRSTSS